MEKMLLREIASPDIPRCIVQSDTSETQEREFVLDRLRLIVTSKSGGRWDFNKPETHCVTVRASRTHENRQRKMNECRQAR